MINSNSADISVFEGLQASANASMGAGSTSQMSVFNSIEDVKKALVYVDFSELEDERQRQAYAKALMAREKELHEFKVKGEERLRKMSDASVELSRKTNVVVLKAAQRITDGLKQNPNDAGLRRDLEELKTYKVGQWALTQVH